MTNKQIDRLLDILDRAVTVAERWADKEYPLVNETPAEGVYVAGTQEEPQTREDYEKFEPGRFEQRFTSST